MFFCLLFIFEKGFWWLEDLFFCKKIRLEDNYLEYCSKIENVVIFSDVFFSKVLELKFLKCVEYMFFVKDKYYGF